MLPNHFFINEGGKKDHLNTTVESSMLNEYKKT
jgi:hypothetical protein